MAKGIEMNHITARYALQADPDVSPSINLAQYMKMQAMQAAS